MRVRLWAILCSFALIISSAAFAERVNLGGAQDFSVDVVESNGTRTVLEYSIGGFHREPVEISGQTYYSLAMPGSGIHMEKGNPSLPFMAHSIIIPDDAHMAIRVVDAEYVDLPNTPVAPSKGSLTRNINPDDVPYEFGAAYTLTGVWPMNVAELREPYILRDHRGIVVQLNAFAYLPGSQTLRVYTSVTVEVVSDGPGQVNVLERNKNTNLMVPEFDRIYQRQFLNYEQAANKYTFLPDYGDMLIITKDEYHDEIMPLVEWKRQKGITTTIVDISTIGNSTTAIDSYIQNFYDDPNNNLAWVLLIGDGPDIVTPTVEGGGSDPSYVLLAGGDSYPDAFIGRFSAQSSADVITQVDRTIAYEKTPGTGGWFHKGTGVASNEGSGQGHNGEADYVHMGYIRNDLLAYTFDEVDEIYAPGASDYHVTNALNDGRAFINYCGHGSTTSWSTTGFNNTDVNNLNNAGMLPYIVSVACVNGNFVSSTCFAEAWLRATDGGQPSGAIGAYMSTVNQDWVPPMHAQDECTDLLVAEEVSTFGGMCFNGSCKMIDLSGSRGIAMYKTWHIFGDPSVQLWTDEPALMSVAHDDVFLIGQSTVAVNAGVAGALCAIYADGIIYGTAYTGAGGLATINLDYDLPVGQTVSLTVTGFNQQPYMTDVMVIAPDGPYLVYDEHVIDDFASNNNGEIDFGETISLDLGIGNVGPDPAADVTVTLSTSDSYVTIIDGSENYGTINGESVGYLNGAFSFSVSPDVPDGHGIMFTLTMIDANDSTWTSEFGVTAHAPVIDFIAVEIDDSQGNYNGVFDPGETVDFVVTLRNTGSGQADNVAGELSPGDAFATVVVSSGDFATLMAGGTTTNELSPFSATASPSAPLGYVETFTIDITAARGYATTVNFDVIIGDRVAFFEDDFSFDQGWGGLGGAAEWTIGPATGGTGSDSYGGPDPAEDHTPTADNGVLGNDLTAGSGGDYSGGLSTTYYVISPVIDCGDFNGCILSFHRWLGVESPSYDHVYLQVYDGTTWQTIFTNTGSIDDTEWTRMEYDVSEYADYNPDFRIRFGMGSTDGSYNYCGWNIDDLELRGYGEMTFGEVEFGSDIVCDSLMPGDMGSTELVVRNLSIDGTLRIRFSSSTYWIDCNDDQLYIAPGDSLIFPVTFNAAGMDPGEYIGELHYASNDIGSKYDTLEVLMYLYAPACAVSTSQISETLGYGETSMQEFTLYNNGPGRLEWSAGCQMFDGKRDIVAKPQAPEVVGYYSVNDKGDEAEPYHAPVGRSAGGPDNFGYSWIDSDDAAGPTFEWVDISGVGTAVSLTDDDATGEINMGITFPFYENNYTTVYIGSNGHLTFGAPSTKRSNTILPASLTPNNQIAIFWDDLDVAEYGSVYYYADAVNERFIASFVGVPFYESPSGTGSLTFQAILYPNGQIILQYLSMDPGDEAAGLAGATIGIENADGLDGLTVTYNAEYVHDNLAIALKAARWMTVAPGEGIVEPFSSEVVTVSFDAAELTDGSYGGQITIETNDPINPTVTVPVTLAIASYLCGDAGSDGSVGVADAVYIVNFVFKDGPAPAPVVSADANGDGNVNVGDVIYIVNYVFSSGPEPICQQ